MNRMDLEWEIKLQILESIARSQTALAVLLENTAGVVAEAGVSPVLIREHARAIEGMQAALLRSVTGFSWQRPKRGIPVPPWIGAGIHPIRKRSREALRVGHSSGSKTRVGGKKNGENNEEADPQPPCEQQEKRRYRA
uniref:Uncharacterized protein n=1 Tax=Cohnella candidum TaxID=2674991 RepID=A0A3G3JT87_9BACL|nr:hypothetical protein EAV92_01845 [Cohnella candidum]